MRDAASPFLNRAVSPPGPSTKLLSEAGLQRALASHRQAGRRVVLTNGVFDLLHPGHVGFLEAARALGDVLVVAVNTDSSVKRTRGATRPIFTAADRGRLLAGLVAVDHVVVFAEATAAGLLERLRPDCYAKGRDYELATLPEREVVDRLGIPVAFVGPTKAWSATGLLAPLAQVARGDCLLPARVSDGTGWVQRCHRAALAAGGLDSLAAVLRRVRIDGVAEGPDSDWVQLVAAGRQLRARWICPARRRDRAEVWALVALRAAGFRAPEPVLALWGREGRRSACVLLTAPPEGPRLNDWARQRGPHLSPRERLEAAEGLGRAVRALHTARFDLPALSLRTLVADPTPAMGTQGVVFLDAGGMRRLRRRIGKRRGARALAQLAAGWEGRRDGREVQAFLRAYLGGTLREARPWIRAVEAAQARGAGREGSPRPYPHAG